MTNIDYINEAATIGTEDAQAGRDMQASVFFLFDSPEYTAYANAYNARVPAKRVVAIGVSKNGQPFRVTVAEAQS